MGLFTGKTAYTRYRVFGETPGNESLLASIEGMAHRENLDSRNADQNVGWVDCHDPGRAEFGDPGRWHFGGHVALTCRVDQKRVSARLFKILFDRRCIAVMQATGLERIGKMQRLEIKEALEAECLAHSLPYVRLVDIIWDTVGGVLWIGTVSASSRDLVAQCFVETFGLKVVPETLTDTLAHGHEWATIEAMCNRFTGNVQTALPLATDEREDILRGKGQALTGDVLARLAKGAEAAFPFEMGSMFTDVSVTIDDRAEIGNDESQLSLKGFATVETATTGIEGGMTVRRARIVARFGEMEFTATIAAGEQIEVTGLSLPAICKGGEEEIYERIGLLDNWIRIVQGLLMWGMEVEKEE